MNTREELSAIFKAEGISLYATRHSFDLECDIALLSSDICELVSIMKENNLKSAFFSRQYADVDDYLISEDDIWDDSMQTISESLQRRYMPQLDDKRKEFNKKVLKFDFSRPFLQCVYCVLNGIQVGVLQADDWLLAVPDKDEVLDEIDRLHNEMRSASVRVEAEQEELEAAQQKKALAEIIEFLDSSTEWHYCTNKKLRENYCSKLVNEYEEQHGIRISWVALFLELEYRWREYKESLK